MTKVYLFKGLFGDQFSGGIETLATALEADGHEVHVHSWLYRYRAQREIAKSYVKGDVICTVGHSLGGNSANWMADWLVDRGIPVFYTATIDATDPEPNQAHQADNFMSHDFRAKEVFGAITFKRPELSHIEIDKDPKVHQRIIDRINAIRS